MKYILLTQIAVAFIPVLALAKLPAPQPPFQLPGTASTIGVEHADFLIYQKADSKIELTTTQVDASILLAGGWTIQAKTAVNRLIVEGDISAQLYTQNSSATLWSPRVNGIQLAASPTRLAANAQYGKRQFGLAGFCEKQNWDLAVSWQAIRLNVVPEPDCHWGVDAHAGYGALQWQARYQTAENWQTSLYWRDFNAKYWHSRVNAPAGVYQNEDLSLTWQPQQLDQQGLALSATYKGWKINWQRLQLDYTGSASLKANSAALANFAGGNYRYKGSANTVVNEWYISRSGALGWFDYTTGLGYLDAKSTGGGNLYKNILFIPIPKLEEQFQLPAHERALNPSLALAIHSGAGEVRVEVDQIIPVDFSASPSAGEQQQSSPEPTRGSTTRGGTTFKLGWRVAW
ncbi:hypothetical protein [Salinibius halmophilus]|uniref:hypothetical protein n=1 Tax=Salinibius halmophilus TaxID=1853216 RepID=UPI000E6623DE|nr:hypothetical protein [Salinibius halmophilus]